MAASSVERRVRLGPVAPSGFPVRSLTRQLDGTSKLREWRMTFCEVWLEYSSVTMQMVSGSLPTRLTKEGG